MLKRHQGATSKRGNHLISWTRGADDTTYVTCTHLIGLVVRHQLVDGRGLCDPQEHGFRLLPPLRRSGAHVAEVAGARALALAGAFHADPGRHALGASVQQTGDVCRVGQSPGLFVPLLRLL